MLQSKLLGKGRYLSPNHAIHETELLEQEAKIVLEIVERWGSVAAMPDGEDSAGRQKLRLATPEELTDRAFQCACLVMDGARKRGLVHAIPGIDELLAAIDG